MELGGFQKNTLIDYPGKVASIVFTIGCNFRCPFCYASELVLPKKIKNQPRVPIADFFDFIKKRKGLIDGIVICGGEPTMQKGLIEFIEKVKENGLKVKLDTNGYLPNILEKLFEKKLLDYVAMDIKSSKKKYKKYSGVNVNISKIEKSINLIKSSGIDYEFRTTVAPGIEKKDILEIVDWIKPAKKYFLQEFSGQKELINPKIQKLLVLNRSSLEEITKEISQNFNICKLR